MGSYHYSLIAGLINFAILAAVLFLIGRKLVPSIFGGRRKHVVEQLHVADVAVENVKKLARETDEANAKGEAECAAAAADKKTADELLADSEKALQMQKRSTRLELTRNALEEVAVKAAELMAGPDNQEARRRMTEKLVRRAEEGLNITSGERAAFLESGSLPVEICSAEPLSEAQLKRMCKAILKALRATGVEASDEQLKLNTDTDESLIGGVYLRIGDTVYDSTLKGMLNRAKESVSVLEHDDEELIDALQEELAAVDRGTAVYQKGTVISVSDGICRITGVSDAMAGELIEFNRDLRGMVMDLEKDNVGVVLLGDYSGLQEGDEVRRSGRIIEVPVGEELIGRVVDALGNPIDGGGDIHTVETRPIESQAPGVIKRRPVSVPMQTGRRAKRPLPSTPSSIKKAKI